MTDTPTFIEVLDVDVGDVVNLPFTLIDREYLKVYADGVLVDSDLYEWTGAQQVTALDGFPVNTLSRFERTTDAEEFNVQPASGYYDTEALNDNFDRAFNLLQEHRDELAERVEVTGDVEVGHTIMLNEVGLYVEGPDADQIASAQAWAEAAQEAAQGFNLVYITPEMHGALPDDGTGAAFNSRQAILDAIDEARSLGVACLGVGPYFVGSSSLDIDIGDGIEYWDGTTSDRPPPIFLGTLRGSSTDAVCKITGHMVASEIKIHHIIGPGKNASMGTPGAGDERIGLLVESTCKVTLDSYSDCNRGLVIQNCFSAEIEVGIGFACSVGFEARIKPGTTTGTNQQCRIRFRKIGGPFTSEAFGDDTLRRSRGSDLGVNITSLKGSICDLGAVEYNQEASDSRGVYIGEDVTDNIFYAYLEGAREDGDLMLCEGFANEIHLSGLDSPSNIKSGKISIQGARNKVFGLGSRIPGASRTATVPGGGSAIIDIADTNYVHGKYRSRKAQTASILAHNIVQTGTAFTFAGSGSKVDSADIPVEFDFLKSYTVTASGSDAVWITSDNITITGETREMLRVVTAIKGVTNHARVAMFILNGVSGAVIGGAVSTGLESTSAYQILEAIEKMPAGLTTIKIRISVRNVVASETGCVVRVCHPLATFNIDAPMSCKAVDILPHADLVHGRIMPTLVNSRRGVSIYPYNATDIVAATLECDTRPMVIITAHATGNDVNLINNLTKDVPTVIINNSGINVNFKPAAGVWAADIVLAPTEGMTVIKTDLNGAIAEDVYMIGRT